MPNALEAHKSIHNALMLKSGLTIVAGQKGGIAKSAISICLYQHLLANGGCDGIVTNDPHSARMKKIVGDKFFVRIPKGARFPALKRSDDLIVDLGGFGEPRAFGILKEARNVLLPTLADQVSLEVCKESLQLIQPLTKGRIAVIGVRTDSEELSLLRELFHPFPVFRFKDSKAIPNLYASGKSLQEQIAARPILRRSYHGILKDIQKISNWLTMEER